MRAISEALSVAPSSVVKWSERRRETGSVSPRRIGGHVLPRIRGAEAGWLRGLVAEPAERGLKVDDRTMWAFARAAGLSFKTNRACQ